MKKHLSKKAHVCKDLLVLCTFLFVVMFMQTVAYTQVGPEENWRNLYGGSGYDFIKSGLPTKDGGFILAGSSDSGIGGHKSEASKGSWDYWIIKVDKTGRKVWDKTFGGSGDDRLVEIVAAKDGFFLLGNTQSGSGGNKTQRSRGLTDFWIVKISPDGAKIWDKTFGGSADDLLSSGVATKDGGIVIGGTSNSPKSGEKSTNSRNASNDYWVLKINSTGGKVWDKIFGGNDNDELIKLMSPSDGNYLLAGNSNSRKGFEKSTDSNVNQLGNYPSVDYWLVAINESGAKVWDKTIGTGKDENLGDIQLASDGGLILSGTRRLTYQFDEYESYRYDNLLISKLSDKGAIQWEKQYDPTPDNYDQIQVYSVVASASGFHVLYNTQYGSDYTYLSKYSWTGVPQYHKLIFDDITYFPTFLKNGNENEIFLGFWKSQDELPDLGLVKFRPEPSVQKQFVNISFTESRYPNKSSVKISGQPISFKNSVSKIEFYADNLKIAEDKTEPFEYVWTEPAVGEHKISLKAFTSKGEIVTSGLTSWNTFAYDGYQAELNYSNLKDPGTNKIGALYNPTLSGGASIRTSDIGDKIRLRFYTEEDGNYLIRIKLKSGNSTTSSCGHISNLKGGYTFWIDNVVALFNSVINSVESKKGTINGGYWGIVQSKAMVLSSGVHFIDIEAKRADGAIDYIEIVRATELLSAQKPISDSSENDFAAYPNPLQGQVNIKLPGALTEEVSVSLFDLNGNIKHVSKHKLTGSDSFVISIPDENLKPGVYSLKVSGKSLNKTLRMTKE